MTSKPSAPKRVTAKRKIVEQPKENVVSEYQMFREVLTQLERGGLMWKLGPITKDWLYKNCIESDASKRLRK